MNEQAIKIVQALLKRQYDDAMVTIYRDTIFTAMKEYAEIKVQEQRDIMSAHLNLRNVPKPKM